MRLFDLSEQYTDLLDLLQEDTDNESLQTMILGLEGKIEEKIENTVLVMKSIEAHADAIDTEIKRLAARKSTLTKNAAYLKQNIETTMRSLAIDKIKGTLHTVSFKKNPPKVKIVNEAEIPFDYYNTPPIEPVLDRIRLLKALKELAEGESIPGAEIIQETSLQIK